MIPISEILGYATASLLDRFLVQSSDYMLKNGPCVIDAEKVALEGDDFYFPSTAETADEPDAVWLIGAVACHLSSGHLPFGGKGRAYQQQNPQAKLPVLRSEHSTLTPLVQRCLQPEAANRISLKELNDEARTIAVKIIAQHPEAGFHNWPVSVSKPQSSNPQLPLLDSQWPEKMRP